MAVSINSHGFIADTTQQAANQWYPSFADTMSRIGRERGWPPMSRPQYDAMRSPHGALLVGDAQAVIEKILYEHELFHHDRFLMQLTDGTMPHAQVMHAIELYGTVVAPAVRRALTPTPNP